MIRLNEVKQNLKALDDGVAASLLMIYIRRRNVRPTPQR